MDYAGSYKKMRVEYKLLPYEFPEINWIQAQIPKQCIEFSTLVLTFSVIVTKPSSPVDGVICISYHQGLIVVTLAIVTQDVEHLATKDHSSKLKLVSQSSYISCGPRCLHASRY